MFAIGEPLPNKTKGYLDDTKTITLSSFFYISRCYLNTENHYSIFCEVLFCKELKGMLFLNFRQKIPSRAFNYPKNNLPVYKIIIGYNL